MEVAYRAKESFGFAVCFCGHRQVIVMAGGDVAQKLPLLCAAFEWRMADGDRRLAP